VVEQVSKIKVYQKMVGSTRTPVVFSHVKWCYWFSAVSVTGKLCTYRKHVCVKSILHCIDVLSTLPPEFFQNYFSWPMYFQLLNICKSMSPPMKKQVSHTDSLLI